MAALALAFVASASWFVPAPAPRCAVQCCDTIPDSLSEQIPPEKLSEAWLRDDKAKELGETLKGCSLYLVGFGARKTAVARLLSRRLPRYRLYDVSAIMCSTYAAMGDNSGTVSLPQLTLHMPPPQLPWAADLFPSSRRLVGRDPLTGLHARPLPWQVQH